MKLYSSKVATDVAMEAVQLFGGNGYMAEYRVEQLARDAKSLMIYAGSNEVQVTHVAKGLLPGFAALAIAGLGSGDYPDRARGRAAQLDGGRFAVVWIRLPPRSSRRIRAASVPAAGSRD